MLIFVALGVVGLVALMHKSAANAVSTQGDTGASNGVNIDDANTPALTKPTYVSSVGLYGTTGRPSPFTGLGSPSSNMGYRTILNMQADPRGASRFNALMHTPTVKGTGLLDPLPDAGTRSKQLLTKDVATGPGQKI